MKVIDYIFILLGTTYGLLNTIAGAVQVKQKIINMWCSIAMISGGMLIGLTVVFSASSFCAFFLMIVGIILIDTSASNNGIKMYGKIHLKHHIIRLIFLISAVIFKLMTFKGRMEKLGSRMIGNIISVKTILISVERRYNLIKNYM